MVCRSSVVEMRWWCDRHGCADHAPGFTNWSIDASTGRMQSPRTCGGTFARHDASSRVDGIRRASVDDTSSSSDIQWTATVFSCSRRRQRLGHFSTREVFPPSVQSSFRLHEYSCTYSSSFQSSLQSSFQIPHFRSDVLVLLHKSVLFTSYHSFQILISNKSVPFLNR
jgi:hypothetical protein